MTKISNILNMRFFWYPQSSLKNVISNYSFCFCIFFTVVVPVSVADSHNCVRLFYKWFYAFADELSFLFNTEDTIYFIAIEIIQIISSFLNELQFFYTL